MDVATKFIAALGSLLGAVAWPCMFGACVFFFRKEIKALLVNIPALFGRMREFEFAGMKAKLDAIASVSSSDGRITDGQALIAADILAAVGSSGNDTIFAELDRLCLQYDSVRRSMPSCSDRTRAMTRIVIKMRGLAPATSSRVEAYKSSGSPGSRLAAVVMMQMDHRIVDIEWILLRFECEAPFIFYHASLALTNAANIETGNRKLEIINAGKKALAKVKSFNGEPDRETISVLEELAGT